ncbi:MAG: hypothetical protein ABI596_08580 [Pyrinomonadaceae bacterium]
MNQKLIRILTLTLFLMMFGTIQVFGQTIYNNIPNPLPGNLFSQPFEAQGTSEFGDRVKFSIGSGRSLATVTQIMSSFGCQSGHWTASNCVTTPGATFSVPVTLTVYNVVAGNQVGSVIGSVTQNFAIPYRPSADLINCTGANAGKWYDAASNTCFNGLATPITFSLGGLVVPNEVIYGIAFNTSHYGYAPIGTAPACYSTAAGCGYDSLNVAVADPGTLSVGFNPAANDAYQYTIYGSCSGLPIIPFGLDAGCWGGYKPAVRFNAANPPSNKNDCKNGGWTSLTTTSGQPFRNQGECVSSTNH